MTNSLRPDAVAPINTPTANDPSKPEPSSRELAQEQPAPLRRAAHRPERHADDVFHAWMLAFATYAGRLDMPMLEPVLDVPNRLVPFSEAMNRKWEDHDCWVHFFEDDRSIERFWNSPTRYLPKLRRFRGVIGLDFSVGWNFPRALKDYNHFRNSACTYWLQLMGVKAIPQVRCERGDYGDVLAGFPKHSVIAIGARSMVRNAQDREVLKDSVRIACDLLDPIHVVWYGSTKFGVTSHLDEIGMPYTVYKGKGRGSLQTAPAPEERC